MAGQLRVDEITDEAGTGSPSFPVGNVGIGTSSPNGKLHVSDSTDGTTLRVANTSSSSAHRALIRLVSTTSTFGAGLFQTNGTDASYPTSSLCAYTFDAQPIVFGTSNTERMRIDSSGRLLVGATSGSAGKMEVVGAPGNGALCIFVNQSATDATFRTVMAFTDNLGGVRGTIRVNNSATQYNTSSDYRLKNITGPITTSGAYIDSLNPVEGTWKVDGSTFVGLIAHEVQEASRTTVATGVKDGEEMQGMDYSNAELIANLIAEVKALRTRVAALESI